MNTLGGDASGVVYQQTPVNCNYIDIQETVTLEVNISDSLPTADGLRDNVNVKLTEDPNVWAWCVGGASRRRYTRKGDHTMWNDKTADGSQDKLTTRSYSHFVLSNTVNINLTNIYTEFNHEDSTGTEACPG